MRRSRRVPGLLSVVVPCYNVEDYLDECLTSLRNQEYADVEIIVVDDGSTDYSAAIAEAHHRKDPRVRVVQRENGGLSVARNTGVPVARGEFLTFIDSDDIVSEDGFRAAIEALRESGSDFAVTNYDRLLRDGSHQPAAPWIRQAHERRLLAATLDEFPEIMVNAVAWSKVYRRRFWDQTELEFPPGALYEDQPVSMAAYARARSFDVVPEVGVSWRIRNDSISQSSTDAANLEAHTASVRDSLNRLERFGGRTAAYQRELQVLANNLPFFARHAATSDDRYWAALQSAINDVMPGEPSEEYVRTVDAADKVLYALIQAGRRDDARVFLELNGRDIQHFPTHLEADGLYFELPLTTGLPATLSRAADTQMPLWHRVREIAWSHDGDLLLAGWAYIRLIDLAENSHEVSLDLVLPDGSRTPLEVTKESVADLDAFTNHWFADYRTGGWRAILRHQDLPVDLSADAHFELTVTAGPISRTATLYSLQSGTLARRAHPYHDDGGRVTVVARRGETLVLSVHRPAFYATAASVDDQGHLHLSIAARTADLKLDRLHVVPAGQPVHLADAVVVADGPNRWSAEVDLTRLPTTAEADPEAWQRPLRFRAVSTQGRASPLAAPTGLPRSPGRRTNAARVITHGGNGELEILDWLPVADSWSVTDDQVEITVHWPELEAARPTAAVLSGNGNSRLGTVTVVDGDTLRLSVPLSQGRWGHEGLALDTGTYTVEVDTADGLRCPIHVDASSPSVPEVSMLTRYRASMAVVRRHVLALTLSPPLTDAERGPRNQHHLQSTTRGRTADQRSVVFRTLYGEAANGNALGVHRELRRRGADITTYWSVRDHTVPVPEGGIALIEGTSEWHEALARSRYHMVDVHQLDWWEKPEGQVIIQTMHGYPYKLMGHAWWHKLGFSHARIESFDRRARDWDYFVSPAHYATPLLTEAFLTPAHATPTILEIGYPRNDILLSSEAGSVRESTRELLGIGPDQTAVLYAPTFRDYLSANDMTAKRVDFLDVERVARALGDDAVILVRGHAFHARGKEAAVEGNSNVIDVTDYPDVNDLILASDVGVLDYSSLRFDYAITRKPMIFLVPDMRRYDANRGGVIDYPPTAPGPLVETTSQVIDLLRDIDRVARENAEKIQAFLNEYVELEDGQASARLVDAVFVPRGDAPPVATESQGSPADRPLTTQ